jgi:predicted metal-dependent hydrolase
MNSPIDKLAIAVAMELFTESISDWWLRNGNYKKDQNVFTEVWSWHCVEELEHRDVLYDFYIKLGGRKKRLSLYLIIFLIPTFVIFDLPPINRTPS